MYLTIALGSFVQESYPGLMNLTAVAGIPPTWLWVIVLLIYCWFFSSRRRHTRLVSDWVQTCALPIRSEEHTSELQSLTNLVCRLIRSEEHTSELQSLTNLVCRLLLEKKNTTDSAEYLSVNTKGWHTCGIRVNDSRVLCWGYDNHGQLGDGQTANNGNPNITTDSSIYSSVSAGYYHTCGIRTNDSRVLCWGEGDYGQLGDSSTSAHNTLNPNVTTDSSVYTSIDAGGFHTCGIRQNDSRILCWGWGLYGTLGDGQTSNKGNPNVTTD